MFLHVSHCAQNRAERQLRLHICPDVFREMATKDRKYYSVLQCTPYRRTHKAKEAKTYYLVPRKDSPGEATMVY